jgi:hypothetical protein
LDENASVPSVLLEECGVPCLVSVGLSMVVGILNMNLINVCQIYSLNALPVLKHASTYFNYAVVVIHKTSHYINFVCSARSVSNKDNSNMSSHVEIKTRAFTFYEAE